MMPTRSLHSTVVFRHPFVLKGLDGVQPAGTYDIETEEELLEGLSFEAYRRVSTTMTRRQPATGALLQAQVVDPAELDRAIAADREAAPAVRD
jgi:hypothetical protein